MSKTTAINALPYPEDSDTPDGPAQIKALADALDTLVWPAGNLGAAAVEEAKIKDAAVTSRKFKPTTGIVAATENLIPGEAYADVPGAALEITPAVASLLLVTAIFDFRGEEGQFIHGTLSLDGVDQAKQALVGATGSALQGGTASQVYRLALSAAKHTIKMRGKRTGAKGFIAAENTQFLYQLVAS